MADEQDDVHIPPEDYARLIGARAMMEYWAGQGNNVAKGWVVTPPEVEEPRLEVDIPRRVITLDGKVYDVASVQALRWLAVLAEHHGEWISGGDLESYDAELIAVRTDKLRKQLPDVIAALITSDTGKGSRLSLA